LLQCPETQGWREELLNNKRLHINEETTLRKTLTVKNVTEQKKLVSLYAVLYVKGKTG
jgi:hypothetical protein